MSLFERMRFKKLPLVTVCVLMAALWSCNKDQLEQVAKLQEQKAELESRVSELPAASDVESSSFNVQFDKDHYWVDAGSSLSVSYCLSMPGTVEVNAGNGWSAAVSRQDDKTGVISITAPDPASPGIITVKATGPEGITSETFKPNLLSSSATLTSIKI